MTTPTTQPWDLERALESALAAEADVAEIDVHAAASRLEERLDRSRRTARVALAGAAAAAVVLVVLLVQGGPDDRRSAPPAEDDRQGGQVTAVVPQGAGLTDIGQPVYRVGSDGRTAWVTDQTQRLTGVALDGGDITTRIELPGEDGSAFDVEPVGDLVWVSLRLSNLVVAVDPRTGDVVHQVRTTGDRGPFGMAVDGGDLWSTAGATLLRIDAATGELLDTIQLPPTTRAYDVAVAGGSVWVTDVGPPFRVLRYQPGRDRLVPTLLPASPAGIAATADAVWVAMVARPELLRVDAESGLVTDRVELPGNGLAVTATGPSVWVGLPEIDQVAEVDARSRRLVRLLQVGSYPPFARQYGDMLLVTSNLGGELVRVPLGD